MGESRVRLEDLAELLAGTVRGDGSRTIEAVRSLEDSGPGDLSLVTEARYLEAARQSSAGSLLVPPDTARDPSFDGRDLLLVEDPKAALVVLLEHLYPRPVAIPGIHETAVLEDGAVVDPSAEVGPFAVVGRSSIIGAGCRIGAHVVIGSDCRIGAESVLHPHAVLYDRTEVGERVEIHAGTVLGADGFGYVHEASQHRKVPQVGRTVVESEVEIGANSAVDRATLGETRIGAGTKVDNLVQVGHNVRIGRLSILCGQAGIAGSTRLGEGVVLAGQAGVTGHIEVGDGVQVAAKSALLQSAESGQMAGIPAVPISAWRRQSIALSKLGEILRRLRKIEKRIEREDES